MKRFSVANSTNMKSILMENIKVIPTARLIEDDDDCEEEEISFAVESKTNFGTKKRKRPNPSKTTA
jgi:hypothetical protein